MGSGGTGGTKRQICRRLTDFETQNRVYPRILFHFQNEQMCIYT